MQNSTSLKIVVVTSLIFAATNMTFAQTNGSGSLNTSGGLNISGSMNTSGSLGSSGSLNTSGGVNGVCASPGWYYLSNGDKVYYNGDGTYYNPKTNVTGGTINQICKKGGQASTTTQTANTNSTNTTNYTSNTSNYTSNYTSNTTTSQNTNQNSSNGMRQSDPSHSAVTRTSSGSGSSGGSSSSGVSGAVGTTSPVSGGSSVRGLSSSFDPLAFTPGVPNTGAGGSSTWNWSMLLMMAVAVIGGVAYVKNQIAIR